MKSSYETSYQIFNIIGKPTNPAYTSMYHEIKQKHEQIEPIIKNLYDSFKLKKAEILKQKTEFDKYDLNKELISSP
jgi:hypothetical protein